MGKNARSAGAHVESVQVQHIIGKDGEVLVTGLPYKKGQTVAVIVFPQPETRSSQGGLTAGRLRQSGLIGLWRDRTDIGDSATYARQLREQAQRRGEIDHDPA